MSPTFSRFLAQLAQTEVISKLTIEERFRLFTSLEPFDSLEDVKNERDRALLAEAFQEANSKIGAA